MLAQSALEICHSGLLGSWDQLSIFSQPALSTAWCLYTPKTRVCITCTCSQVQMLCIAAIACIGSCRHLRAQCPRCEGLSAHTIVHGRAIIMCLLHPIGNGSMTLEDQSLMCSPQPLPLWVHQAMAMPLVLCVAAWHRGLHARHGHHVCPPMAMASATITTISECSDA